MACHEKKVRTKVVALETAEMYLAKASDRNMKSYKIQRIKCKQILSN